MSDFALVPEAIALPRGAWAKTHRTRLMRDGRTLLGLTQGEFRAYVYPLATPAGFQVTSERPADHPHHASLWIASDHVHAMVPAAAGTTEEYTYNFYVDEVFQGRAPGRIAETSHEGAQAAQDRFAIVQQLEWRGPREWAAETGRPVARETRTIAIHAGERRLRLDVSSRLVADDFDLRLGPTRHAYFNVRVADSMIVANGGAIRDDRGRAGGEAATGEGARWVDFSGPVGGGHVAGITVIPLAEDGRAPFWFVADWGVLTVGTFRHRPLALARGEAFESRCTVLVHDGPADLEEIRTIAGG